MTEVRQTRRRAAPDYQGSGLSRGNRNSALGGDGKVKCFTDTRAQSEYVHARGDGHEEANGVIVTTSASAGDGSLDMLRADDLLEPDPAGVAVTCFGRFSVVAHGEPVGTWRSGKALALFGYLATHRGRPISRDALIQALWPDPDALAAGISLKVAVHALRQTLKPLTDDLVVRTHEVGYELCARNVWVDVDIFVSSCRRAHRLESAGQSTEALKLYARAADLYQGDFLAESGEEWVVFRREGLRDEYLCAIARLADGALAAGDWSNCLYRCQQMLEQDPCREDAFRLLMMCHAHLGQPGRVQQWYDLCVRTLRRELGMEPDSATVRVYQAAVGARVSAQGAAP